MHQNNQHVKGFTIIELMLAMVFFSSILMLCMLTFVQILGIYNKGTAIKEMNQAGRTLTDNIIRQASSSTTSSVTIKTTEAGDSGPRCMVIGNTTYMWSFASDTAVTANAYKKPSSTEPINFVRTNGLISGCPGNGSVLSDTVKYSPMLSDALRVYAVTITRDASISLVNVKFSFGTFAGSGAANNPVLAGSSLSCSNNPSIGNYCAFGNYETAIYLPNPLVGP